VHNFGCISASDALPFNVSSSSDQVVEQPGNTRLDLGGKIIDGHDSARSRHLAKVPMASNTGGPVSERTICAGAGIGQCHMTSKTNSTLKHLEEQFVLCNLVLAVPWEFWEGIVLWSLGFQQKATAIVWQYQTNLDFLVIDFRYQSLPLSGGKVPMLFHKEKMKSRM
jgi:hypothetical protein